MSSPVVYAFVSVFILSAASLAGIGLLLLRESLLERTVLLFVGFATGAMFGNAFLHILPEVMEVSSDITASFVLVLAGIVFSFLLEKLIHWHHHHTSDCPHVHPVGSLVLLGDGIHNITDGMLIMAAYLVDINVGIATTVAVLLHEIPQEIGDFAVLIHSGYSRIQALFWNFVSALSALLGIMVVLLARGQIDGIEMFLLPIAAGNFIYIAGADLIPELQKQTRVTQSIVQIISLLLGMGFMYVLLLLE